MYNIFTYLTALAMTVYVAYSGKITANKELENIWEESAVIGVEVLLRHFLRESEGNHENIQSRIATVGPIFQIRMCGIGNRSVTDSIKTFSKMCKSETTNYSSTSRRDISADLHKKDTTTWRRELSRSVK